MTNKVSYYVYEHRRKDTGEVFYVGKGTKTKDTGYKRSSSKATRNPLWNNIVKKCSGFIVNIIAEFFNEDDAFNFEILKIKEYGRKIDGGILCNMTLGGEGHLGRKLSDETKNKMSIARKGQKRTPEQNKAISIRLTGVAKTKEHRKNLSIARTGKKTTEAVKLKMSEQRTGEKHPRYGKAVTESQRKKQSESRKGKCVGSDNCNYGKAMSNEQKEKLSIARKGKSNEKNKKPIIDLDTGIKYSCAKEYADYIGVSVCTVQRNLKGKSKSITNIRYA